MKHYSVASGLFSVSLLAGPTVSPKDQASSL
jgi:hypothetical protein